MCSAILFCLPVYFDLSPRGIAGLSEWDVRRRAQFAFLPPSMNGAVRQLRRPFTPGTRPAPSCAPTSGGCGDGTERGRVHWRQLGRRRGIVGWWVRQWWRRERLGRLWRQRFRDDEQRLDARWVVQR